MYWTISHMGIISSYLDYCKIFSLNQREEIISCIRSKNTHDLKNIAKKYNLDKETVNLLNELLSVNSDFGKALKQLKNYLYTDEMRKAYNELNELFAALEKIGMEKSVHLDLSLINDIDYYNGLVFKGYINGIHKAILSGGRYDRLTEKFNRTIGAMGFAIYLGDLLYFYDSNDEFDVDVLLLYNDRVDIGTVFQKSEELRKKGMTVRIDKNIPTNLKYKEKIFLNNSQEVENA